MTKTITTLFISLCLTIHFSFGQQPDKETVYFDYDTYQLNENAKIALVKLSEEIKENQPLQIIITGHTDADGSNEYNLELSKKRTLTVLEYLTSNGINSNKIKIEFFGENQPIAQNDNSEGKQLNRRVEIYTKNKEFVIGNLWEKLHKKPQSFQRTPNEDIVIKGSEGTIIKIPKKALVRNNGETARGEVTIALTEYYKKSDMVSSNLHTMSNTEILETAGMINIEATSNTEKLKLKKGAAIQIEFNSQKDMEGMETFIGEMSNGQLNWVPQRPLIEIPNTDVIFAEESIPRDTASIITKVRKVDKLILSSYELGWINCDRFREFTNKTDLKINIDSKFEPHVRLVFKDINSIMPPNYSKEKKIIFESIPVGQQATLVAFSLVNEETYFVSKDIIIRPNQKEELTLVKTTLEALQQDLIQLNK